MSESLRGEIAQPQEYYLLKGHNRTDGSFKSDEQLLSEYVSLTDDLVYKITDGIDIVDSTSHEVCRVKPDVVVWLDKSARPVSWLTRELWPVLAADSNGEIPEMPAFRYANIDREQWVNVIDPIGVGLLDVDAIDPSIIRSLRSIFIDPKHKQQGLTEAIDIAPTELDGKSVLIVDEVYASGRTLDMAAKFFNKAFPDSQIAITHWMKGQAIKSTRGSIAFGNADLPVWYNSLDVRGRGVGDRDDIGSLSSKSLTQRLGAWFLSTRLPIDDPLSSKLREDMHHLARDVKKHEVLVVPSLLREDFDDRAAHLNDMNNIDEFIAAKRLLDNNI